MRRGEMLVDTRLTIINQFYDQGGEEERLSRSRQGQLEFLTTMRYIHRWSGHKMNILEIGAGTGRWTRRFALRSPGTFRR